MRYLLSLLPLLPLYAYTAAAAPQQLALSTPETEYNVHPSILSAVDSFADPVEALLSLQPELAQALTTPRLLDVAGEDGAVWMTEGDKLRLRREGRFFIDITDRPDALKAESFAGHPSQ